MKTLMHIIRLSLIMILLASLNSCKKSGDNDPNKNTGGTGSYTYLGKTSTTTRGDYLIADGNVYLYVYGQDVTDIVQIIFSQTSSIPEGTFSHRTVASGNYDPAKNFSGGSVTTAAHPEGISLVSGNVIVAKTSTGYAVTFDCATASGTMKGSYTGAFTSR